MSRHMTTNRPRHALLTVLQLADLVIIAFGFALSVASELRPELSLSVLELRIRVGNIVFLAGFLGYCHLVMRSLGLYRSYRLTSVSREWRDLAWVVLAATLVPFAAGCRLGSRGYTRSTQRCRRLAP